MGYVMKKIKNLDLYDLYIFAFGVMVFLNVLRTSLINQSINFNLLSQIMRIIIILAPICIISKIRLTFINFFYSMILFVIVFSSAMITRNPNILLIISIAIMSSVVSYKKLILSGVLGIFIAIIVNFFALGTGLIPNLSTFRLDGSPRYALGFNRPVVLPSLYFTIVLSILYLYGQKLGKFLIFLIIPIFALFTIADSRGAFFRITLAIIIYLLLNNKYFKLKLDRKINFIYKINIFLLIFSIFFSIYMAINFTNNNYFLSELNRFMTGRLGWWNRYWNIYPVTLLGNNLTRISQAAARNTNQTAMILDSTYLTLLLEFGMLQFLIIISAFYSLLKFLKKRKNFEGLLVWGIFLTFALTANAPLSIERNLFIVHFGMVLRELFVENHVVQHHVVHEKNFEKAGMT